MNRNQSIAFFLYLQFLLFPFAINSSFVRDTNYGKVQGKLHVTEKKNVAEVYLGVPYAEPPVGHLRFQYPKFPILWNETKMCTDFGPICTQFPQSMSVESEDCLYVNILIPYKGNKTSVLHPVLIWIHGGSYTVGGANWFPLESTINNIVTDGIVLVFVNYRLGPFGYLSLGNESLPGNFGLEDQLLVLKWVQHNIEFFDGSPDQVTITGESAGAASVSLLAMSPKAKGLFRRVILRSGSSLSPWAVTVDITKRYSASVVETLNCSANEGKLLQCLQQRTVAQFQKAIEHAISEGTIRNYGYTKGKITLNYLAFHSLTPTVDNFRGNDSIIPDEPGILVQSAPPVPLLAGTTSAENLQQLHEICHKFNLFKFHKMKEMENRANETFEIFKYTFPYSNNNIRFEWAGIMPTLFRNPRLVFEAIQLKYFGSSEISQFSKMEHLITITQVLSDLMMVAPVLREAEFYVNKDSPVYLYQIEHTHPQLVECSGNCNDYINGTFHGMDLALMFQSTSVIGEELNLTDWTLEDLSLIRLLWKQVSNFVKTGNPNSLDNEDCLWSQFSPNKENVLHIKSNEHKMKNSGKSLIHFWYSTVPVIDRLSECDE